jgi:hypothetical protein
VCSSDLGVAHAQSSTGVSGISGGIGSDFAASNVSGATTKSDGGLAASLDAAFGDEVSESEPKK